jgi:hypothetical protein
MDRCVVDGPRRRSGALHGDTGDYPLAEVGWELGSEDRAAGVVAGAARGGAMSNKDLLLNAALRIARNHGHDMVLFKGKVERHDEKSWICRGCHRSIMWTDMWDLPVDQYCINFDRELQENCEPLTQEEWDSMSEGEEDVWRPDD